MVLFEHDPTRSRPGDGNPTYCLDLFHMLYRVMDDCTWKASLIFHDVDEEPPTAGQLPVRRLVLHTYKRARLQMVINQLTIAYPTNCSSVAYHSPLVPVPNQQHLQSASAFGLFNARA
jgi:hypothetical protein